MFRDDQEIPFDVKPQRAIPFRLANPKDITKAIDDLRGAVDEVLKPGFEVETPVTRARGVQKIDEHAMPEMEVLRGDILQLQKRMIGVEAEARFARLTAQQANSALALASEVPGIWTRSLSSAFGEPRPRHATMQANSAVF
jgi:hypothetical protein